MIFPQTQTQKLDFSQMAVFAIVKSEIKWLIETSEGYRYIMMLGQKMGYEISVSQMQYNADN